MVEAKVDRYAVRTNKELSTLHILAICLCLRVGWVEQQKGTSISLVPSIHSIGRGVKRFRKKAENLRGLCRKIEILQLLLRRLE
jgi:hypothetical protein